MTNPAGTIKDEVRLLIDVQIETFGQPTQLTSPQLGEYFHRAEKIRMLCKELDRTGARSIRERQLQIVS